MCCSCCLVTSMAEFTRDPLLHPQSSMQTCSLKQAFSLPARPNAGNTTDRVPGLRGCSLGTTQSTARGLPLAGSLLLPHAHNTSPSLWADVQRHRRPSWAPGPAPTPFQPLLSISLPQFLHLPQHTITRPFISPADFCVFLKFALCARHSARC